MKQDIEENDIGSRLKKVRKELRLTQARLADHLNVSGASISELEAGKYKPGHDFYFEIAKEFNVNLYYIIFGEGEMFDNRKRAVNLPVVNKISDSTAQEIETFFNDFSRSSLLQHLILEHYYFMIHTKKEPIEMELTAFEEKE